MIKTRKNLLLTIILTICLAACLLLAVACDKTPQDTTVKYTVTVKYDDDTPVKGVSVQLEKGAVSYDPRATDSEGKVSFDLVAGNYTVSLDDLPDGYNVGGEEYTLTEDKNEVTITLKKNFTYSVKVVDKSGLPYYAAGVKAMICTIEVDRPGTCLSGVAIQSNGVATIEADPYNYHAKLLGLPANVKYDCDSEGYYTRETLSATKTSLTITVYDVVSVTDANPMTMNEKTAFANGSEYTADADIAAYHFEGTIPANSAAYYSITPEIDGEYRIYYKNAVAANYLFGGDSFSSEVSGNAMYYGTPYLKSGTTYYFYVVNNNASALNYEFVMESPSASHTQTNLVGDVKVTVLKEGANAVIELSPSIGAVYTVTGPANVKTSIVINGNSSSNVEHPDDSYKTNAKCTARFTEDRIGSSVYFSIAVKDTTYPATFNVKIEKGANLSNTTNIKHAEAELKQFDSQQGSLTYIPLDGTAALITKGSDGYYRLGENGPVVLVMLTGNLPASRFATTDGGALAYIDRNVDGGRYRLILDVTEDKTSLTHGNAYNDYRIMLRGFADYKLTFNGPNTSYDFPDSITEEHYYAKYSNADGVYPLTDELKGFLEVMAKCYPDNIPQNTAAGCEWLFACCYYNADLSEEKDVIIGTYENSDGLILNVNADMSWEILEEGAETVKRENGTWEKDSDGHYTFTVQSFNTFTYAVTRNADTGALSFAENKQGEDPVTYEFTVKTESESTNN